MAAEIAKTVFEKVSSLPLESQKDVLRFVEEVEMKGAEQFASDAKTRRLKLWDTIDEIVASVPDEAWEDVPTDGSINVDHYLYGAPKRQI